MSVRLAVQDDAPAILELLRSKHEEDGIGAFDEKKVLRTIERGTLRYRAIIGVIRGKSCLEASIGLFMTEPWNSSDVVLSDRWIFVAPQHRRSSHAKDLLVFAKLAATELGCPLSMTMMMALDDNMAARTRLFDRHFPVRGLSYFFDPSETASEDHCDANQKRLLGRVDRSVIYDFLNLDAETRWEIGRRLGKPSSRQKAAG